ncbi:ATP-dependent Clp protease ATP-binding subunit [Roseomonas hellenica]|uniref:ATP-dependent Clp protease ATP-binding subunit n=1 Tax=Plastoroseomonas hellenica TaxID=2687306 RepID=A0ABS5EWR3_9PROT|nr:AAA family ATPase [Plastoroseomonas hellenica]MBR0664746.1 ATP-dependent Clp protease ATP-binding subunit [Plastoroseomonas hellenica]
MSHLIRGTDYLGRFPNFELRGRDKDLERVSAILMRKRANSLLLVGPAGVGVSALILGLQSIKTKPGTPFDIIVKRLFFLDTDRLFSSGDGHLINEEFQKVLRQLQTTPESVLIIEDTFGFIEAARTSGNPHFVNALNFAVKSDKTQVVLEVRDEHLSQVLKWHSDLQEAYTLFDVREPVGVFLYDIVAAVSKELSEHHGIVASDEAIREAIALTSKYRDGMGLGGAQPTRSISLIDRSLASYRQHAHRKHPRIAELELKVSGSAGQERADFEKALAEWSADWTALQAKIGEAHRLQRDGEEAIFALQDERDRLRQERARRAVESDQHASSAEDAVRIRSFAELAAAGGFETPAEAEISRKIAQFEKVVGENQREHRRLVEIVNKDLRLTEKEVRIEFSEISGISTERLGEDEREVLRNLEGNLLKNIFGQDPVVRHVANAVKVARIDEMEETGPKGSFMFLGPSGVGKTEMAKRLAAELGLELLRFDMSEYMEKHAVAKLIGAPPGYEGFEAGGILTNAVRRKPVCVLLFDEVEKAHPDVFNVFLQILSDARLTDNLGRTVDFRETYIVMTTNIGQPFYLDMTLTDEEAQERALIELNQTYRSELLNRFNGRENILHFRRLGMEVIERIISREIDKLNKAYDARGLRVVMAENSLQEFCRAHYDPTRGARGLPGYIKANLRPILVNHVLENARSTGAFLVRFNNESRGFEVEFREHQHA